MHYWAFGDARDLGMLMVSGACLQCPDKTGVREELEEHAVYRRRASKTRAAATDDAGAPATTNTTPTAHTSRHVRCRPIIARAVRARGDPAPVYMISISTADSLSGSRVSVFRVGVVFCFLSGSRLRLLVCLLVCCCFISIRIYTVLRPHLFPLIDIASRHGHLPHLISSRILRLRALALPPALCTSAFRRPII